MKDKVEVLDHVELSGGGLHVVAPPVRDKEFVVIEGFVSLVMRERGKIVARREGKNIWTLAGREHLARHMSYASYSPDTPARNDRIRYIGFGIGSQEEVSTVTRLTSPVAYDVGGTFLAELAIPTYPFQSSVTTFGGSVQYTREFSETELSTAGSITLTEIGIFTDGSPTSAPIPYTPGTRDRTLVNAGSQAPNGYKSFEALKKTQNFVLQVAYEVRF